MVIKLGTIKNASEPARVFYGMHMEPGTAEYIDKEQKPYKILLNEDTVKRMNATFTGKPVYVDHVDKVDLSKVEREAAGWVIESFYNKYDGKTWCKFLIFSDAGHDAIRNGWKLSNAYIPTSLGTSGRWHGMEYEKEVLNAEYEHLAIVSNPRYEASVIMDPDQFKAYNQMKEAELLQIANSNENKKEKKPMKFNIFKREKVENSADLETLMVTLPKSKKDIVLTEAIELADKFVNMSGYAADEHMVKCNDDEEMTVGELRDCYGKMKSEMDEMKKKNSEAEEADKLKEHGVKVNEEEEEKKKNEEEEKKKKENLDKEEQDVKQNSAHFEKLQNAIKNAESEKENVILMNSDRVAKGKELF